MSMAPPSSSRRHGPSASVPSALPTTPSSNGMRTSPSDSVISSAAGPSYTSLPPPPVHRSPVTPLSNPSAGAGLTPASRASTSSSRPRPAHSPFPSQSSIPPPSPARPVTPGHRVTRSVGCFPVTPNSVESRRKTWESPLAKTPKEPTLPNNPIVWTPSELAQYLAFALRTGGVDQAGPTLPAPVVEDVVSWVLRSRVTGQQFLRGVEQGVTRPPPFLPVLAAISRRLRRGHRVSDISDTGVTEDEGSPDEGVTRVRRLAHAFEVISSASEASGDEGPSLSSLREQVAPETVHGFGRATPKNETRRWSRRDSTASTMSSASVASGFSGSSNPRWRQRVASNTSTTLDSPEASTSNVPQSPSPVRTSKAEGKQKDEDHGILSPPPPYDIPSALPSPARPGLLFPPPRREAPSTPESEHSNRSGSVTPLCIDQNSDISSDENSPTLAHHLHRMISHKAGGVDPYAVLRRDNDRRPQLPFAKDDDDSDEPHWTTTRRVTARPTRTQTPESMTPAINPARTTPSKRRRHEREMEREVAALNGRIRELEDRLAVVEVPREESSPLPSPLSPTKAVVPYRKHGWFDREQDAPVALFLAGMGLGVGVGAIAVRLLLGRSR